MAGQSLYEWITQAIVEAVRDALGHGDNYLPPLTPPDEAGARTALTDTETNQRGYLLTQDASYLIQYDAAIAQIRLASRSNFEKISTITVSSMKRSLRLGAGGAVDLPPRAELVRNQPGLSRFLLETETVHGKEDRQRPHRQ